MDRLWAMEVFVRVVECGSFSKAATSLDLANATVTACVRNLEKHLGVTLIQRNTRHLYLTDEGNLFFPRCQEVLSSVPHAESEIRAEDGKVRGALSLETPISLGHALICPALNLFTQRHPLVSVSVSLTNQPRDLIKHAIDIAIRMDHVEEGDLVAKPIYETRYVMCGAPDRVRDLPARPADLDPTLCLGLISDAPREPSEWGFHRHDEHVTVKPKGALNFNSSDALVDAALRGAGLIYVLDIFVKRHIANGLLVQLYDDWTTSERTFYAVTAKTQYVPAKVRAFIDFLMELPDAQQRPNSRRLVEVKKARR